ncbi:MAG: head decoration protein [Nitrospirota bacterium]
MPTLVEPMNLGDLLKYEAPNLYSRDPATVAAGQSLVLGSVVGRETATNKLKALDPTATDGTELPAGVLIVDADATAADLDAVIVARHAIVARHVLVWPAGITPAQQSAAIAALEARGILVREGA